MTDIPKEAPRNILLQFVLFPLGIVLVAVGVFFLFGKLATEQHSIPDYLNAIRSGSSHERWQAAYQLSKSLKRGEASRYPNLEQQVAAIYEQSKSDDPRLFVKAVRKVAAGEKFISPHLAEAVAFEGAAIKANPATQMNGRELEILRLLGRGDKIVEVASALEISYKTVANTTSLLKQKLGAKNHSDLVRIAVEMGLG